MTRQEIEDTVGGIIAAIAACNQDEVVPEACLVDDLCLDSLLDSLDAINIQIELDREFGTHFFSYEVDELGCKTVKDVYDIVEQALNE